MRGLRPAPIDRRGARAGRWSARVLGGALTALLVVAGASGAATEAAAGTPAAPSSTPPFSPAERAALLALGPWPPPAPAPARPEAVALGELLFHSARLAGDGSLRCASCHEPWRRYTDGLARAEGRTTGARNTPTLLNVAQHRVFGWDGAHDSLADQSLRPMRDPAEMAASPAHVAALLRDDPALRQRYAAATGAPPPPDDDAVFAQVGQLLAAYESTLASARTPFDAWRDALADGALSGAPSLPVAALRGARLFVGRGGCVACHAGPMLGDDAFHVSTVHSSRPDGRPDTGRAGTPANAFRTPSLREAAATGPYMHDGSVARLCDAARPHALPDAGPAADGDAPLDAAERDDVAAFLLSLTADPRPDPDTPALQPCAAR
jgi:cytochrome c peroxidase